MDPNLVQSTPQIEEEEDDEWDTDGFEIPSLSVGESDLTKLNVPEVKDNKISVSKVTKEEENIYLGPHGTPPFQVKQQMPSSTSGRKQRFKQKLKEADRKYLGVGRENKVENLRELVGSSKGSSSLPKNSLGNWLDPHCDESQFERAYSQN